jgi:hypothetical protein
MRIPVRVSCAVRAVAIGADPGDLLGAEAPAALEVLRDALAARLWRRYVRVDGREPGQRAHGNR